MLQVRATDEDKGVNGQVKYSIVQQPNQKGTKFTVDEETGEVSTNKVSTLYARREFARRYVRPSGRVSKSVHSYGGLPTSVCCFVHPSRLVSGFRPRRGRREIRVRHHQGYRSGRPVSRGRLFVHRRDNRRQRQSSAFRPSSNTERRDIDCHHRIVLSLCTA